MDLQSTGSMLGRPPSTEEIPLFSHLAIIECFKKMHLQHSAGQHKHSTGLGVLTLTFMWVTNSLVYSGVPDRINMLSFLEMHKFML